MREILFRGQKPLTKKWVEGLVFFSHENGIYNITYSNGWTPSYYNPDEGESTIYTDVIPETIGQYTGLKDKNGTKIFEGDILGGYPHGNVVVKWNDEWACFESYSTEIHFDEDGEPFEKDVTALFSNDLKDCFNEWIILGNIHDNPELLNID